MAEAYMCYEDYNECYNIVFADSMEHAMELFSKEYGLDEDEPCDFISRIPMLDFMNRPSGYRVNWDRPEDREVLLKAGIKSSMDGGCRPMDCCKYCDYACDEDCEEYMMFMGKDMLDEEKS